jgi:hypothetical protein
MRDRRRTPAGGVQAEKQRRYVQLLAQGVSNSEACRLVAINPRRGIVGGTAGGFGIPPGRLSSMRR